RIEDTAALSEGETHVAVGDGTSADRQIASDGVEDAPSLAAAPVADRQARQDDRLAGIDIEHTTACSTDRQLPGARALDRQHFVDEQFAAGERDGLTFEAGSEIDRVAAFRVSDLEP